MVGDVAFDASIAYSTHRRWSLRCRTRFRRVPGFPLVIA